MCANLFSKPKVQAPVVEKVAPAPTPQSQGETKAISDQAAAERKNRRAAFNADKTRVVANESLMGQAQSGNRTTLG